MMKLPHHFGRNALLGLVLAAGSIACGQRGPLELPEKARPIQRIEPPPTPPSDTQDDEQKNER
jgi:predicted small lipoprotein YifL